MRAFLFGAIAIGFSLGIGAPAPAQPTHPITLRVESGVHQFEINKVEPNSVSVKLGAAYKFTFSRNEIRSATSEVVGAAIANARILLNRSKSLDLSRIGRLVEDLERSAKELAELAAVYQWLIPEASATWTQVESARARVAGTLSALEEADPHKRTINRYLAGGYPFPDDWKEVFERAHAALARIPVEQLRESEIDHLSELYERFENLTNRQTDRSLIHIEDLRKEIRSLIDSEKLTHNLWGQLRVRIDRSLARIQAEEVRKEVEESLAPVVREAQEFLEQHKERLGLQEIEERLSRLEGLAEISPASAEAVASEATLVATLLAGVDEEAVRNRLTGRLAQVRDRLQVTVRTETQESKSASVPTVEAPNVEAPSKEPLVQSAPAPLQAAIPPRDQPPEPAPVPVYQNRNFLIAMGAGVCALLLVSLLRLSRKGRKQAVQPAAPRNVFKEPAPLPVLASSYQDREDRYSREFSNPAPPIEQPQSKPFEAPMETPASPFPDLPAIAETPPAPVRFQEPTEPVSTREETSDSPPMTETMAMAGGFELDSFFAPSSEPVAGPSPDSEIAPALEADSPTPFTELTEGPPPSLDSIFGDQLGYPPEAQASLGPEPSTSSAPETDFQESSTFPIEDPLELSSPPVSEAPVIDSPSWKQSESFPWDAPSAEPEREDQLPEDFGEESDSFPTPVLEVEDPPIPLVLEDMAARAPSPDSTQEEESSMVEEEPVETPELPAAAPPPLPIELEPLVLASGLVELDGAESLERTGTLIRLGQGIPFPGLKPIRMFSLGQAVGLVGARNGNRELIILDRAVDGGLTGSTALMEGQTLYTVARLFGVYWAQDEKGVTVFDRVDGGLERVVESRPKQQSQSPRQPRPHSLVSVYRPVSAYDEYLFVVSPEGRLEGHRWVEDADPRTAELIWSFPSEDPSRELVSNTVPLGDRLAVVDTKHNLILVEPSDGRIYWEGPLEDLYFPPSGPVVLASIGNRLVFVCQTPAEGMYVADFAGPGTPSNRHSIRKCKYPSLFAMDDGVLLLSESEIAFFEDRDLALSWSMPLEEEEPIDLSVDRSQIAVVLKRSDETTRALVLGKNSGAVLWETDPEEAEMVRFAGAVVQDGNLLLWGEDTHGNAVLRLMD